MIYNNIKKEVKRIAVKAAMPFNNQRDNKFRTVGYKFVEFTYDVNPNFPDDKMQISSRIIKITYKN